MTHDPDKAPDTGEPTPKSEDAFRQEATAFLSDKPEPSYESEPRHQSETRAPWEKPSDWQTTPTEPPKQRRSILFPIALILLGGLAMAYNFNLLPNDLWYWMWRLWPVWLIIAGLEIAFGRKKGWFGWIIFGLVVTGVSGAIWGGQTFWGVVNGTQVQAGPGSGQSASVDFPLEGAKEAEVRLSPGIAHLQVGSVTDDTKLAQGEVWSPPGLTVRSDLNRQGDRAILSVSQRGSTSFRFGRFDAQPWQVNLSPKLPLRLSVDGGVGRSDLDLRELQVTDLSLNIGVGETNITLPKAGKLQVRVESGVGKVTMEIPRSMGALVRANAGLGGVEVDGVFDHNGRTYQTPNYATSANQAEITVNGGVGKIEIHLID